MQPSAGVMRMAAAMCRDCWEQQAAMASVANEAEARKLQTKIDQVLERIVEASSPSVIRAFEEKVERLENEHLVLIERSQSGQRSGYTFDELFEHSLDFLASPWNIWQSGRFDLQRLVLRLAFCDHLTCCRETGRLNTRKSLFFKALEQICSGKKEMVLPVRIELTASPLPRECSTTELRQPIARWRQIRRLEPEC